MKRRHEQSSNPLAAVQIVRSRREFGIWYCENGKRLSLVGTVATHLAIDANRHGQDLVGELVEQALRLADRRRTEAGTPT
jgi:hypothetical protein